MAKKSVKRNPQDTTLRNTRAANKKLIDLTERLEKLEQLAHSLWAVGARVEALELWRVEEHKKQSSDVPEGGQG